MISWDINFYKEICTRKGNLVSELRKSLIHNGFGYSVSVAYSFQLPHVTQCFFLFEASMTTIVSFDNQGSKCQSISCYISSEAGMASV
jgi:hypothetical protein